MYSSGGGYRTNLIRMYVYPVARKTLYIIVYYFGAYVVVIRT